MNNGDPLAIPRLSEIFEALRRGRHICSEDGDLYWAVRDNIEILERLFSGLGFRLETHPRDFYYFHGTGSLSDRSERMAVFMFILVEWLSDRGDRVEETLMTRKFDVGEMPHLQLERYRQYMNEAGIADENGIADIIRNLERFGFARRHGDRLFSFKSPVFRFVDLCYAVLEMDGESPEGKSAGGDMGEEGS